MSLTPPPLPAENGPLTEADLRAQCERDLARLEAISQAATELALELHRRTMQAMQDDDQGVPSRAIIAFNRAARVQRQTMLLAHRLRRELRGQDRAPAAASAPSSDSEDRAEATLHHLADADDHPDHQVERLAAEAAERLEREDFDPALVRSVDRSITVLHEELAFVRALAQPEEDAPQSPASLTGHPFSAHPGEGRDPGRGSDLPPPHQPPISPGSRLSSG